MMILKRANRTALWLSSSAFLAKRFSDNTSYIITAFEHMIKNQRFEDVAEGFKKLSENENEQFGSLLPLILEEVNENREKWDANVITDIANTISLTKHLYTAEKFYSVLYERFDELTDDSRVKLLHLLTKIPEKEGKFHSLYYEKIVPLLNNMRNNPKSFSVALIAFLHLYDYYTEAQIECITYMVYYYKWSLVPKHCVNILTYSKPPLLNKLMEILMENINFYAKYDLLITN